MDNNDSEDLTKLDDTAPEHQWQQWNKETVSNHELESKTTNFQYIYGYYAILIMTFQEHPLIVIWKRVKKAKDQSIAKNTFCITQIRIRIKLTRKI